MKIFAKKGILQKTIIVILAVLLINFIVPTYSTAKSGNAIGGIILSPLVDLVCSLGDVVVNLLQRCMTGSWGAGVEDASFNMFLVEDDEFWSESKYNNMKTSEEGQRINPEEEFDLGWFGLSDKYHIPVATYSPEQIFSGKVAGLDINFINPNKFTKSDGTEVESSAAQLQQAIATWYVALRNLAIVGLLSVLVYVGIRMVISSSATDKAKYKQMFTDWLIALCLLFFLHYIMSFIITLTESICTAIGGDGETSIIMTTTEGSFKTNLLGAARFKTQYEDLSQKVTYLIFYVALVTYTVLFTWTYLKRMLMMAFLTLIAPLVALTYPIDKISDGKAQAFDTWLKEYAFNALLQPFHLIIYIVFVGTAMDLVESNMLYAIAALGFILPAEKILRGIFGFNKAGAGTLGALGGFTAASLLNKFKGGGGSKGGKTGSGGENSGKDDSNKPPRFENKHNAGDIDGEQGSENYNKNEGQNSNGEQAEDPSEKMRRERFEELKAEGFDENDDEWKKAEKQFAGNNSTNTENSDNKDSEEKKIKGKRLGGMSNLARHHNITPGGVAKGIGKGAWKGIKGVAKFGTKTAFRAAAGTVGGAIGLASGQGIGGVLAGVSGGVAIGGRIGDSVSRAPGAVVNTVNNATNAIRNEIDVFNGNTDRQDKSSIKDFHKDPNNQQYLKDMMTKERGGVVPSAREVKDKMATLDPYVKEGLTDIKDMLKAQKAETYGISSKQSATIAALSKERGIDASTLSDDKKYASQLKNLTHEFQNKKGVSEDIAKQMADKTLNVMKAQNGVAHTLKAPASNTKK